MSLQNPLMLLIPSSNRALPDGAEWLEYPSQMPEADLTERVSDRTGRLLCHCSEGAAGSDGLWEQREAAGWQWLCEPLLPAAEEPTIPFQK